jgi:hypothetical protein
VSAESQVLNLDLCGLVSWLTPIHSLEPKITAKFKSNFINITKMVLIRKLVSALPLLPRLEILKLQVNLWSWAKMENIPCK